MSQAPVEFELIEQAVRGDRAALSQLLLLHYDSLYQHVAARLPSRLQGLIRPDDILQQTFVRAAQAMATFRPQHAGSLRAWLRTIAENLLRDAEKRRRRERRWSGNGVVGTAPVPGLTSVRGLEQVAGGHTTPGHRVQRRESIRRLRDAVQQLPEDQRDVVRRYYLQGQTLDEIAAASERTKDAVRGLCYRARKSLHKMLGNSSLYFSG